MTIFKKQKGYTLVELILTIAVMGILAGIATPLIGNSNDAMSLDGVSKKIESELRYAQSLATTTSDSYGFDATGQTTYQVYKYENGVKTVVDSPHDHQPLSYDMADKYPGVNFVADSFPTYTVIFDETGKPTTGGGTTITLTTQDGDTKTITISSGTGNININ